MERFYRLRRDSVNTKPCNLIALLTHTLPLQLVMGDGTRFIDP